ncbi:hypothetical protein HII28_10370 [Planctomonas sp. JC2975]|uniref:hypothetical protein n=1 Tax=Planctomonas sp. JC2975 TaxID=2729626 RepID=UPI001474DA8A|nr:hypothetical protein [Planctomonas sp. JC2975]NNC12280.1 hypothetical protein [Planctomonas sp. JC2975]
MNTLSHTQIHFPNSARRWIGISAILGAVFAMAELPLYFVVPACDPAVCGVETGSPMPDGLILTRTLFNFLALTLFLVFMTGVRFLIARADARYEWFGTVAGTAGVAWTIIDMVAKGLEGGSAIKATEMIDPTRTVPTYLLYGSISHLMLFVFGLAFGYAVLRTQALPRWVGWSSFAVAVLHLAGVPSMFFGYNSSEFYASNGWGAVAMFNGIAALWLAAVGIAILRRRPAATAR